MKICSVIEPSGGGAGRHFIDLTRELARRGHETTVVYSPLRAESRFLDELKTLPGRPIEVAMHRSLGFHDITAIRQLNAVFREQGPFDIIHGHSSKAGALIRLANCGPAKRVYTPHAFRGLDPHLGFASRRFFNLAETALGMRTDALIAVSRDELMFARQLGIKPELTFLVRNGVIVPRTIDRAATRTALGIRQGEMLVGFVGRMSAQKNPEHFVRAVSAAMRSHGNLRAMMIGDGELAPLVDAQIAASEFSDRFIRRGGIDAQEFIGAFDILMMTSVYEGLSYVMLECVAAGVPLVTTAVAGAREVIDDGVEGILVEGEGENQTEALTQALLQLVGDEPRRLAMANASSERGRALNGTRMIDEIEAIYRRIVNTGEAPGP